jgi:hypothetical protein
LVTHINTNNMEHLIISCSTCQGTGQVDISQSPEPWVGHNGGCEDCTGKGYIYSEDEIVQRIEDVDCMIQGFIDRLDETARYVSYLHKQGLGHMTVRLTNKMDNCARAIARLRQYRIKLMKL